MRISILGTNGFLSTAIAKYANDKGWHLSIFGLDEPREHSYDVFQKINLMDADLDCSCLLDADIIVYAIGAGIQSNLKEGANLIYALTVNAPVSICNKLKELNYKGRVVTFGSYFELGECDLQHPATEQDIINAVAPAPTDYVVSKRMLTRFVSSYKHNFTHWHFILPTIFGAGENPLRLIPYSINAIRKHEEVHFTSGQQVRQYIHIDNIPRILDLSLKNHVPSDIYNIEGKDIASVKEIIENLYKAFNINIPHNCFGKTSRSDISMPYLALCGDKLKELIGEYCFDSIEHHIKDYK